MQGLLLLTEAGIMAGWALTNEDFYTIKTQKFSENEMLWTQ